MYQIALLDSARIARSVAAITLGLVISTVSPAQAEESVTERNRHFIAEAFSKWARGGTTFFKDVLAPEVVWTIKGSGPTSGVYRGRDEFLKKAVAPFAERLASPLRPVVKDIWAERNDVIVHWDGTAVTADGKSYSNSYVWIFRMKDLRATEVTAFLDLVPYDDVLNRIKRAPAQSPEDN